VGDVLADFPHIADRNGGITSSYATGEGVEGVGATRHCDLEPLGKLEETVVEWDEGERMVVSIDSAAGLPIHRATATFTLSAGADTDPASTTVGLDDESTTKYGFVGRLMKGGLERRLEKGFDGFLADLDAAASAGSTTTTT
jgi:hypothetical protein